MSIYTFSSCYSFVLLRGDVVHVRILDTRYNLILSHHFLTLKIFYYFYKTED